jgi:ABC-type thiamin/hydroxymethylpyrimidine transport system permease subunit
MKIDRPGKTSIVIGKRVTFGSIVGGVVTFGVWLWNATHPEIQIPAEQAVVLTTIVTGVGQVLIANRYGITQ